MKLFLALFFSFAMATPCAYSKEVRVRESKQNVFVVTGYAREDNPLEIFIDVKDDYTFENFIDKPVYKIASFSADGKEKEVRFFDVEEKIGMAACAKPAKDCSSTRRSRLFTIFMKDYPDVHLVQLIKNGKVISETNRYKSK